MPGKSITIKDTPEGVAGRLPGFCRTNPAGIGITVEEERAPRGLIYFRVHCGNKKSASAKLELRLEQGKCVIGWGWRQGLTVLGKPGNPADLQRCKEFCIGFLMDLSAKYASLPNSEGNRDSGHYNFSRDMRQKLVNQYRSDRNLGKVTTKHAWAERTNICDKTLLKYEREFPEP